jgi:DNA-binding NtrC family response regulator
MAEETVLVVAEREAWRARVCEMLRGHGFAAIPVRSGPEAHWCAERHAARIDLVLSELLPPEADAYHAGIALGALWAERPVVFTGPRPHAETVRDGVLHPHAPYLQQPFPAAALARKVRETLDRWRGPAVS